MVWKWNQFSGIGIQFDRGVWRNGQRSFGSCSLRFVSSNALGVRAVSQVRLMVNDDTFKLFGRNFQFEVLRLMLLRFGPSNLRFSKMWNPHVHWTALNGIDPVENSTKFNRAFGKLAWQLSKSVIWELQCGFLFRKECSDLNVLLNCKSHEMLDGSRN